MKQEDYLTAQVAALLNGNIIEAISEGTRVYHRPSLYEAQKWMRENKKISVEPYSSAYGWNFEICKTNGTHILDSHKLPFDVTIMNDGGSYDNYETALNEGIKHALNFCNNGKSK